MTIYSWPSTANIADAVATARLREAGATLLGTATPSTDVMREAMIAEMAGQLNLYTPTEIVTLLNNLRAFALNHRIGGSDPTFAIDTNFDVKNTETTIFLANGVVYTLADNTSCDTGTTKVIAANQWAAMLITGSTASALTGTWTADAASEAAAIVLVKALSVADQCPLGYVTVKTGTDVTWTAGTDALKTGAGGTAASETNYYQYDNMVKVTAAVS